MSLVRPEDAIEDELLVGAAATPLLFREGMMRNFLSNVVVCCLMKMGQRLGTTRQWGWMACKR